MARHRALFAVSARSAERAMSMTGQARDELIGRSRIVELRRALIRLADRRRTLHVVSVVRSARIELTRLDREIGVRIKAITAGSTDVRPEKDERVRPSAHGRFAHRTWSLALNTETARARVETVTRLQARLAELEGSYLDTIDRTSGDVSESLSRSLHALSVWLSREMELRSRTIVRRVGERIQTDGFDPYPLQHVPRLVDARLRYAPDVGEYPAFGRPSTDPPAARQWLREILTRARAELRDEVMRYFTDLHSVMALTLDEVVARRLHESDAHLADTGTAVTPRGTDDSGRRPPWRGNVRSCGQRQADRLCADPVPPTPGGCDDTSLAPGA